MWAAFCPMHLAQIDPNPTITAFIVSSAVRLESATVHIKGFTSSLRVTTVKSQDTRSLLNKQAANWERSKGYLSAE